MYLEEIYSDSFKNLATQTINLAPKTGISIFLGQNAQGKTNLLEAIRFLTLPKPLKSRHLDDCAKNDTNHFRIKGIIATGDPQPLILEFAYQKSPLKRIYKVNNGSTTINDFLGNLLAVIFTPDDLNLLTGSPSLRRRLLDILLTQISPEYFAAYSDFHHILKQRNALLRQIAARRIEHRQLPIWDQKLAAAMLVIYNHRRMLMDFIVKELTLGYRELANTEDKISIDYRWSDHEFTIDELLNRISDTISDDLRYGHTTFGPHRDDFTIKLNGHPVKTAASRGELRSLVLSLKILELRYLEQSTNKKPILMLDDVFSELDASRRAKLIELSKGYQTLITTVEKSYFNDLVEPSSIYTVNTGYIKQNLL